MAYWRSVSQAEVDIIVAPSVAIEVKASSMVHDRHLKGLRALKEEGLIKKYIVVSLDKEKRLTNDNIHILPWQVFLSELWKNQII